MDTPELPRSFLTAGREYVDRLRYLGMDLEVAAWAFDEVVGSFVIVLVTDFFDVKGPLQVSRILFKAYETSVTPKEIDPFSVRLHSNNHTFANDIRYWAVNPGPIQKLDQTTLEPTGETFAIEGGSSGGMQFRKSWLLFSAVSEASRSASDVRRRWNRFVQNVDSAAA